LSALANDIRMALLERSSGPFSGTTICVSSRTLVLFEAIDGDWWYYTPSHMLQDRPRLFGYPIVALSGIPDFEFVISEYPR
jgi:hypothetical protein